jgi:O-ureido-D-serine cyclo-ligase
MNHGSPSRPLVALVTARAARDLDEDLPPLREALAQAGARVEVACWDDETVDWSTFDLALLRSTWDYWQRLDEFLTWAERASKRTALANPLPVIRWNTDKHYLGALAEAGVPIVPSRFVEPADDARRAVEEFLERHFAAEIVVKPAVGAGSRDVQRHDRTDLAAITGHVRALQRSARSALLQPYLDRVDEHGETALMFFAGRFSHAIRKGPLLRRGEGPTQALFAPEEIRAREPSAEELNVAEQVVRAIPFGPLPYARVDLIRDDAGAPRLLELELTEPSLFFAYGAGSVARFARVILNHGVAQRA